MTGAKYACRRGEMFIRCPDCGEDSWFIVIGIATTEIKTRLYPRMLPHPVLITCGSCNNRWKYPPDTPTPPRLKPPEKQRRKRQ